MFKNNVLRILVYLIFISNLFRCTQSDKRSTVTEFTTPIPSPNFVISDPEIRFVFISHAGNQAYLKFRYQGAVNGVKFFYHKLEDKGYYVKGIPSNFDTGKGFAESGYIDNCPLLSIPGNHIVSCYLEDKGGNFSNILEVPFTVP